MRLETATGHDPYKMNCDRPFNDVRIVDLSGELSAYAARLFANLGTEVVMVEPPGRYGGAAEDFIPRPLGRGGAKFLFCNAGKKSVELDIETNDGKTRLADLIAMSQVVLLERSAPTPLYS